MFSRLPASDNGRNNYIGHFQLREDMMPTDCKLVLDLDGEIIMNLGAVG